ncbi:MAG: site-2 protease family protein [Patescibacteria group bacterium]|nr:site-2 protease family protein [Patescibacteria group bacterium]
MLVTLIVFLVILSLLVLIHEFGHFLVAKKLGIKVEEFGFGFPPNALKIKKGETVYSINWLPIGGFVKLFGEDEAGGGKIKFQPKADRSLTGKVKSSKLKVKDEKRAFFARSVWQRALVVVAGVLMNTLLAVVIFYLFLYISNFKTQVLLITDHKFIGVSQTNKNVDGQDPVVSIVAPNSPAEKAGIKAPSRIIRINQDKIKDREELIKIINANKGREINITWVEMSTGKEFSARITPRVSPPKNEGALGIGFIPIAILDYQTTSQKIFSGVVHPINLLSYNFDIMGKLISVSVKEKNAAPLGDSVSGPVGIFSLVGNIVQIPDFKERMLQILNLAGILSVSLAFFNILPIPALDGGRLFFILIEAVTGRKVPQRIESLAHTIGMALLLALIVMITFKDIFRIFR